MKLITLFLATALIIASPMMARAEKMNDAEYDFVLRHKDRLVGAEIFSTEKNIVSTTGIRQVKLIQVNRETGLCKISHLFGVFHLHWTKLVYPEI